jgi:hypothetical protein
LELNAANAQWTAANHTLTANDGSWHLVVNNDGTYTFTEVSARLKIRSPIG